MAYSHQIHELISKEEDLIYRPEHVYWLLSNSKLLPSDHANIKQPEFITILNYLFDKAQIETILKAIGKLDDNKTSLNDVLEWSWSRVVNLKTELSNTSSFF